jgi:hypothetical protein
VDRKRYPITEHEVSGIEQWTNDTKNRLEHHSFHKYTDYASTGSVIQLNGLADG